MKKSLPPSHAVRTILFISPYWKEEHRWMASTVKLAELWQRLGYRVIVVCMGSVSSVEEVSPTLTIHRRKDVFLPDPWNYGIAFGFSGYVRRLAAREQPDLIIVNKLLFWTSLAAIGLRMRGYRVLQLTDALVGMTWWPRGRIPRLCAALYAWTLGWLLLAIATKVIFFHPQSATLLRRLGIAKKTMVIPTGIDPEGFGQRDRTDERIVVTYLGRLESIKGVDDFLAAAAPLISEFPALQVQVVGWHKEQHPLVEAYKEKVTFTGLRHDIAEVLGTTDIFVLPSHSEGLSNALMEAMASGCACIASDVGGNSFLIQNGSTGFLFPAGDRDALRAHMHRLLVDKTKRTALGIAARQRIEEEFSWKIIGRRYDAFFASNCL